MKVKLIIILFYYIFVEN